MQLYNIIVQHWKRSPRLGLRGCLEPTSLVTSSWPSKREKLRKQFAYCFDLFVSNWYKVIVWSIWKQEVVLSTQHLLLPMEEVQSCWTTVQLRVPLYLLCLFICLFVSKVIYRFGSCLHCRWCYCQCLILLAALLARHGSMVVYCRNDRWSALGKLLGEVVN